MEATAVASVDWGGAHGGINLQLALSRTLGVILVGAIVGRYLWEEFDSGGPEGSWLKVEGVTDGGLNSFWHCPEGRRFWAAEAARHVGRKVVSSVIWLGREVNETATLLWCTPSPEPIP